MALKVPVLTWIFTVGVPMVYLALLPGLSQSRPFGGTGFASPLRAGHMSISEMVTTTQANGGFAAFTAPTIGYMWFNPMAQRSESALQLLGALFFTVGWLLSVLLPLDFASGRSHAIGFAFGMLGPLVLCIGLLAWTRWSILLLVWFGLIVIFDIAAISLFSYETAAFLAIEYVIAFLTASLVPLANTCLTIDDAPTVPWPVVDGPRGVRISLRRVRGLGRL